MNHNPVSDTPLLSLAMIVRDGGQLFTSLLEAAAPHVDEMVIGDTGSSDGCDEVARGLGARVFDLPWEDDFAAVRNQVLERCRGRWILIMDADEQLCPVDWRGLRRWVEQHTASEDWLAGTMLTRNYLTGLHPKRGWTPNPAPDHQALPQGNPAPGYVPTSKVRLFPNHPEIRFHGHLHETVEASLRATNTSTTLLPFVVHHFGMLPDHSTADQVQAKARRYLRLARLKASDNPHLPAAWSELAECAINCGDLEQALTAIERALVLAPINPAFRLTAGWIQRELGRLDEADQHLAAAENAPAQTDGLRAEVAHLRAQIAMLRDRPTLAGPLLNRALKLAPGNPHFLNTLGAWQLQMGRGEQARLILERAHALCPQATEPLVNLGLLYRAAEHPDLAQQMYRLALERDPDCARALQGLEALNAELQPA